MAPSASEVGQCPLPQSREVDYSEAFATGLEVTGPGSTHRAEILGDQAWYELLSIHNSIVRRQVALHGGSEIKAQGDGFMLTLASRAPTPCTPSSGAKEPRR